MKRTFNPNEFAFEQSDLDTPEALLATLNRMDPSSINTPGYASKLFQAVTNQNNFDNDAWVDMCMDICAKQQLQDFTQELGKWHESHNVKQLFLPDILADSYAHSATSKGWVHTIVDNAGIAPGAETGKRPTSEHQVQINHTGMGM